MTNVLLFFESTEFSSCLNNKYLDIVKSWNKVKKTTNYEAIH